VDAISTVLTASLCLVVATALPSVALLCSVVATPQPLGTLLWLVYVSLQLFVDQLPPAPYGVGQLSSEFSGSCSELHLLSALGSATPSVSVPGSMTRCSVVSVTSHSGACLALV
jgi:hypothetical protein